MKKFKSSEGTQYVNIYAPTDSVDIVSELQNRAISLEERHRIAEIRVRRFDNSNTDTEVLTSSTMSVATEPTAVAHYNSRSFQSNVATRADGGNYLDQNSVLSSGSPSDYFNPNVSDSYQRPSIIEFPREPIVTDTNALSFANTLISSAVLPEGLIFPVPNIPLKHANSITLRTTTQNLFYYHTVLDFVFIKDTYYSILLNVTNNLSTALSN